MESLPAITFAVGDLELMANKVAASRLMPGIDTPQAAFTLMLLCQSEGLHPAQALRRYHIIKGRPSMRADAMQAEFQRQGGIVQWVRSDERECIARFVHPVQAPEGVEIHWNLEQARAAGLLGNDNWKKYPRQMLRARCISEGVRAVLPGVVAGIYTPEEVQDFEPLPAPRPARAATGSAAAASPLPEDLAEAAPAAGEHWDTIADLFVDTVTAEVAATLDGRTLTNDQQKQLRVSRHRLAIGVAKDAIESGRIEAPAPGGLNASWSRSQLIELTQREPQWVTAVVEEKAAKLRHLAEQIAAGPAPSAEVDGPRQQSLPAGKGEAYDDDLTDAA